MVWRRARLRGATDCTTVSPRKFCCSLFGLREPASGSRRVRLHLDRRRSEGFVNTLGQFSRGPLCWFQGKLVRPTYPSRHLHRYEKRGNGANGNSQTCETLEE